MDICTLGIGEEWMGQFYFHVAMGAQEEQFIFM
jgi:hypothetical protein